MWLRSFYVISLFSVAVIASEIVCLCFVNEILAMTVTLKSEITYIYTMTMPDSVCRSVTLVYFALVVNVCISH